MEELCDEEQSLVKAAIAATENAYAEYSHFYVGAALLLDGGVVVVGANQENASFPLGLCAERSAIFGAQSNYPDRAIKTIAIAARNENGLLHNPVSPCGGCRQVILGIEDRYKKPIRILLYGTDGIYCLEKATDLMPLCFVDACMH